MALHPSIQQYIDLYRSERERIESHSVSALNRLRPEALSTLESLPSAPGVELTDMLAPDYGINITRMPLTADAAASFRCSVPGLTAHTGLCAGDIYSFPAADTLPDGVIFGSICDVTATHPDLIENLCGSVAPLSDPVVALNTLLAQDGALLYLRRGVRPDCLFQIVSIFGAPVDMMAPRRLLVVLEDDAEARLLLCDHSSRSDHRYLSVQVAEVILGRGAHLELFDIEDTNHVSDRLFSLYTRQAEDSDLTSTAMSLNGAASVNYVEALIDSPRSHCELRGMVTADGSQRVTHRTLVRHETTDSTSRQLYKYVLDGESNGRFEGLIRVADSSARTEAYQSNRNLLASPQARMYSRPQLEIYCDDVKCSHGATTGQPDGEALFYMQTRGIPKEQARRMLMQAFMADVLAGVRPEALRERLTRMVEARFEHPADTPQPEACDRCGVADGCRLRNDSE